MTYHSRVEGQVFHVLTDEQAQAIVVATLGVMGEASEEYLLEVCQYVDEALMRHALIENVLSGDMAIVGIDAGGEPWFKLTAKGDANAELLVRDAGGSGA